MEKNRLIIPWPHRDLSPNARKDRRDLASIKREYKWACWALTKKSGFRATHLDITFCPPDARRRDLDNMLAAIKSGIDGIALAMGVDDFHFTYTIRKGAPDHPHGSIVVRRGIDTAEIPHRGVVT